MKIDAGDMLPASLTKRIKNGRGVNYIPGAKLLIRGNKMYQAFTPNKLSSQILLAYGMKLSPIVCAVMELNG